MFDEKTLIARYGEGDDAILALFREWLDLWRRYEKEPIGKNDEGDDILDVAATERADEIAEEIYGMSASGAAGVVIKAYLAAFHLGFEDHPLVDNDRSFGEMLPGVEVNLSAERAVKSFARAAVQFVPELKLFAARALDAPVKLPPAGRRAA